MNKITLFLIFLITTLILGGNAFMLWKTKQRKLFIAPFVMFLISFIIFFILLCEIGTYYLMEVFYR